jgi:hypothetical protein
MRGPRSLSRYSDWLSDEGPRGLSSKPGGVKNILFSISYRPALTPLQQLPGDKWPEREADHSPPISAEVDEKCIYTSAFVYVSIYTYIHSLIRHHDVVLSYLISGTTLPHIYVQEISPSKPAGHNFCCSKREVY